MAKRNKVYIDIEINGKMQKVAVDSKKLAGNLKDVETNARTADRGLKGASQQSSNGTKNFSKMAQGINTGLVPAYATLAANVFAITALFDGLKRAADFRVIKEAQVAFSSATGVGLMSLTANIKSATDGLVGFKDASQAAAIGTASGLNVEQINSLAKGAREVSLILGRDVTDSFNRLIRGVTKAEPELLDELGITLRLTDATEKYAATLGKAAKDLSLYEKSQSVAVEVQRQLDEKYSSVAASVDLQSNAIAQLGVAFEKVLHPIQKFTSALAEPAARFLADNIKALAAAFGLLMIPIIKAIIPGLDDWAENSELAAGRATQALEAHRNELEELRLAQTTLKQSGQDPNKAAQAALAGVKSKSAGIGKLQSGDFGKLSKREITGLLNAAEKGKGAVTQMSNTMKRQYIAALREMKNKSKTTFTDIGYQTDVLKQKAVLNFKAMQLQWQIAMTKMKRAVASFSKFTNKVMKLAGLIGVLIMLKDLAIGVSNAFGLFKQKDDVTSLADDLKNLNQVLETTNKEFAKFVEIQTKYYDKRGGTVNPTLEGLSAVGNFIDSQQKGIEDALSTMDKYYNYVNAGQEERNKQLAVEQDRLAAAQKVIADVQANRKRVLALPGIGEHNIQGAYGEGQINTTAEMIKGVKDAEAAIKALHQVEKDRLADLDPTFMEKYGLGFEDVKSQALEAEKNIKTMATTMVAGLRAARIETQAGGARFIELNEILAETGTLTPSLRKEYDKLEDTLIGLGAQARIATQEFNELNRSFDTKMAGITTFTTSVTDLISRTKEQISLFSKGGKLFDTDDAPEKLKVSTDRLKVLNRLKEMEIGLTLRSLGIEKTKTQLMLGATTLEKEGIVRAAQLATISSKRLDLQNKLALATEDGITADAAKVQELNLQLDILGLQEDQLRRNQDIVLDTLDKMEDTFENSFQTNLADLIKGKESSFKTAFAKIAEDTLNSAADNIAKHMTSMLFGDEKTPEDKIKAGMMEAANYHASEIAKATGNTSYSPSQSTGAVDRATGGFLSGITNFGKKLYGQSATQTSTTGEENGMGTVTTTGTKESGLKGLFTGFTSDMQNLFKGDAPFLTRLGNVFTNAGVNLQGIFATLLSGIGSFLSTLFGTGTSTASQIGNMFLQSAISVGVSWGTQALSNAATSSAAMGTPGASGASHAYTDFSGHARYGGVFSEGKMMPGYATGGIAKGSQGGYPAMLHGTEAVVPLPNNKSIPVDLKGAGQQNNVTVNVSMESGGGGQKNSSADSNRGSKIGDVIAQAVQKELLNQKRSGGILSPHGVS